MTTATALSLTELLIKPETRPAVQPAYFQQIGSREQAMDAQGHRLQYDSNTRLYHNWYGMSDSWVWFPWNCIRANHHPIDYDAVFVDGLDILAIELKPEQVLKNHLRNSQKVSLQAPGFDVMCVGQEPPHRYAPLDKYFQKHDGSWRPYSDHWKNPKHHPWLPSGVQVPEEIMTLTMFGGATLTFVISKSRVLSDAALVVMDTLHQRFDDRWTMALFDPEPDQVLDALKPGSLVEYSKDGRRWQNQTINDLQGFINCLVTRAGYWPDPSLKQAPINRWDSQ